MRQSFHSSPWRRIVSAMQRLTTRPVIELLPTLELRPTATPGKVVETRSSRFAPTEETLPPAAGSTANTTVSSPAMVTAIPVFATPLAPHRSTRSVSSPVVSSPVVRAATVRAAAIGVPLDARLTATTIDPAIEDPAIEDPAIEDPAIEETTIEETTGSATSPRQASRSRNSRQVGPVKVTVGDYSAIRGNTASVSRERIARETYALRSRELERAADKRLAYEQQLVERRIREQLEASQRELHWSLDEILEDTVILPRSIRDSENS